MGVTGLTFTVCFSTQEYKLVAANYSGSPMKCCGGVNFVMEYPYLVSWYGNLDNLQLDGLLSSSMDFYFAFYLKSVCLVSKHSLQY